MANLLQLKITLRDIKPPIWRRVELPDSLTFWELHFVLQILFAWENAHLFEFRTGRGSINDFLTGSPPLIPGEEEDMFEWWRDPRETPLADILTKPKDKVTYVYDFGDYWEHGVVVEKVVPLAEGHPTPAVRCLAGRRAAPPEDIGGFPGYEMLVELLAEKTAGKRKRLPAEYAGLSKFDPEEFILAEFNQDLAHLREIVAEAEALMADYRRQMAANPPPRQALDIDALLAAMQANMPPPLHSATAPKKPKK